jgi:hypothetical protein
MAKKRTELEARVLEEHGRVISAVERWQSEQQAVDEVRASLAEAEARLDEAVLEGAELGDRHMVARLLDLPEAQVRKAMAVARRAVKQRAADAQTEGTAPSHRTRKGGGAGPHEADGFRVGAHGEASDEGVE